MSGKILLTSSLSSEQCEFSQASLLPPSWIREYLLTHLSISLSIYPCSHHRTVFILWHKIFTVISCVVLMFLLWWMCNLNLSFHLDIHITFYLLKQNQNFSLFLLLFNIMVQVIKYSCILVFLLPFSPASISGFQNASAAVSCAGLSPCYPLPPSHRSLTILM